MKFGRYQDVDLAIARDGEASLALLIEAVKRLADPSRKSACETRGKKLAAAHQAMVEQTKSDATLGWDASPITTARMRGGLCPDQRPGLVDGQYLHPIELGSCRTAVC